MWRPVVALGALWVWNIGFNPTFHQLLLALARGARVYASTSRRPSKARPSVTSSAYSRSPPTGSPLAMRVTSMPSGFSSRGEVHRGCFALDVGVGGEDHLVDTVLLDAREQLLDAQLLGTDPSIGEIAPCSTW